MQQLFLRDLNVTESGQISGETSYVMDTGVIAYEPSSMESVYNAANSTVFFDNIAQSMTNSIRANADSRPVTTGMLGSPVVFIRVRWAYIALPAALLIAGTAFLGIVIYYTRKEGIAIWGTEILPLLMWNIRDGEAIDGTVPLSDLVALAKTHHLQIVGNKTNNGKDVKFGEKLEAINVSVTEDNAKNV